ncbi:hypothetical protein EON65_49935 [archaeon]|nr:MAG: hypothetical protein EON65_49935 [archaeon]
MLDLCGELLDDGNDVLNGVADYSFTSDIPEPASAGKRQRTQFIDYDEQVTFCAGLLQQYQNLPYKLEWFTGNETEWGCYVSKNKVNGDVFVHCRICDCDITQSVSGKKANYTTHLKSCHAFLYNFIGVNRHKKQLQAHPDTAPKLDIVHLTGQDVSGFNYVLFNILCYCHQCVKKA